MTEIIKKNVSMESLLCEYMTQFQEQDIKNQPIKKKQKIVLDEDVMPTIHNFEILNKYNYNLQQLKTFAKFYKLKQSGNKQQLLNRVYSYLKLSFYATNIQKNCRARIIRKYLNAHGPAARNRALCTNMNDFITMEPINEIQFHQFISYKDIDGFTYGFDISSLYNLYLKSSGGGTKNPYNRNAIPKSLLRNIRTIMRVSKMLNIKVDLSFEDVTDVVSIEKAIETRAVTIFQHIDSLGNYSNANWFLSLNMRKLYEFVMQLADIWDYRAQLSIEVKRRICPRGDPLRHINEVYLLRESNILNIKNTVLSAIEYLVYTGVDNDSKSLGAYFVLGALTLVNEDAANSLPWLYQSMI